MTRAKHSPLFVAKDLLENRYKGAELIFIGGSVIRGEATTYSDIDLVVVYRNLKQAYRESFFHLDWPVEAFVHDPATLQYFYENVDRPCGRPALPEMVSEGLAVPGATEFSQSLKDAAELVLEHGPDQLSSEDIDQRRYTISALLDDVRETANRSELLASATLIYNEVLDYYFRVRGMWSARGKSSLKRLKKSDPVFFRRFTEGFDVLFATGRPEKVIELVDELLSPHGGLLFENYRLVAPASWRKDSAENAVLVSAPRAGKA